MNGAGKGPLAAPGMDLGPKSKVILQSAIKPPLLYAFRTRVVDRVPYGFSLRQTKGFFTDIVVAMFWFHSPRMTGADILGISIILA